jgi:hypothetical protein
MDMVGNINRIKPYARYKCYDQSTLDATRLDGSQRVQEPKSTKSKKRGGAE